VGIPGLDAEARITREQFEAAARPLLARTVRATAATLRAASAPAGRIARLFLVGGSTRMPLVATLLSQELHISPTLVEHPEVVVAEGALHHTA
jgi:molecular chaperone DnaK (HSP70)